MDFRQDVPGSKWAWGLFTERQSTNRFYRLDYEERFRKAVIDRFAEAYAEGETPIPCVDCNRHVKFTDLLETATQLGADARSANSMAVGTLGAAFILRGFTAPVRRAEWEAGVDLGSFGLRQGRASVATPLSGGFACGTCASCGYVAAGQQVSPMWLTTVSAPSRPKVPSRNGRHDTP